MVRSGLVRSQTAGLSGSTKLTVVDCAPPLVSRPLTLNFTIPADPLDLSRKVALYVWPETFVTLTLQRATPGW